MPNDNLAIRSRLAAILGSMVGATALGGCADDLRKPFDESFCEEGNVMFLQNIEPHVVADYVARRRATSYASPATLLESTGVCGTPTACDKVSVEPTSSGFQSGFDGSSEHLVVSRGDDVQLLLTVDEVRAFVGTIDTPQEAALLVYVSGYDLDCKDNNIKRLGLDYLVYAESGHTCGGNVRGYQILVSPDGALEESKSRVVERGDKNCVIGRLPEGLREDSLTRQEDGLAAFPSNEQLSEAALIGAHFAEVAYHEAAAVAAFEALAQELEALSAPRELVERARQAAREERRHTILTGALARRFGHERKIPRVDGKPPRSAYRMALDNAVEGLTRETYGALLGLYQSTAASDPTVRQAMRLIAHDEANHAEFSWQLHQFLLPLLTSDECVEVDRVRKTALLRFRNAVAHEQYDIEVRSALGLPSAEIALRLYDELFAPLRVPRG